MSGASARMTAAAVAAAMFMSQLDGTVIHTALPAMSRSFGVAPVDLSIGVTIYLLAQAVFLPASAWLADRLGSKRVFAASVVCFTASSLLCGLTHTLEQFVAARILQGASAALMTPVGSALLVRTTDRAKLVHVLTLTSTAVLVAPTFGPAIGGFCVTYLSWPWAFFVNILRSGPDHGHNRADAEFHARRRYGDRAVLDRADDCRPGAGRYPFRRDTVETRDPV